MNLSLFVQRLVSMRLRLCAHPIVKVLVSVFFKGQLCGSGDDQWLPVPVPQRSNQIAVHLSDELQRYPLWTDCFAFAVVRATAEVLVSHCSDHAERSLVTLGLALRKRIEVSDLGRGEKHGGGVGTGGDTCAAADAVGSVQGRICGLH